MFGKLLIPDFLTWYSMKVGKEEDGRERGKEERLCHSLRE